jgi:hypothetical protein
VGKHTILFGLKKGRRAGRVAQVVEYKASKCEAHYHQKKSWALVTHPYNPSHSGGRDQEDCSSKPAWVYSSARPYLEKPFTINRAGRVAQGVGPEFKSRYHTHKKNVWDMARGRLPVQQVPGPEFKATKIKKN